MFFVELPLFTKHAPFTDDELAALQQTLLDNPLAGDLIPDAGGDARWMIRYSLIC